MVFQDTAGNSNSTPIYTLTTTTKIQLLLISQQFQKMLHYFMEMNL